MSRVLIAYTVWLLASSVAPAAAPPDDGPEGQVKSAHAPRGYSRSVERAEWEIGFADEITIEEYARQIDYFKIEIAAVSKNGKVETISEVSQRKPKRHVGNKAADYRLHIGWKNGTLHAADRKLLARAGISSQGKELSHFFPSETQVRLADLEHAYAGRDPAEINRTRFEIRPKTKGAGYEFVVVEQDPPAPRASEPSAPALSDEPASD